MKIRLLGLIVAVILGAGLRLAYLSERPPGLTWDEAALGYNAFSILKTGKDEFGQSLPIVFKSFGDYKPGLYVYLTVPFVKVLGLNVFATRLPAAVAGIISIVLTFVIAELWLSKKYSVPAAILMAINPWSLAFSRGAWEAGVFLTLVLLGVVLFQKKKYYLAFLFLGLTFWTYQSAKLFTPLLVLGLLAFNYSKDFIRQIWRPGVVMLALAAPIALGLFTQGGRLKVVSVFSYTRQEADIQRILSEDHTSEKNFTFNLFHAELLDQARGVALRYFGHLSAYYLFFAGDFTNLRESIPYYGYFHIPEIITMILGLIVLVRSDFKYKNLVGYWLIISPIPSALSRDLVSGVRALPLVVPLVLLSSIGFRTIWDKGLLKIVLLAVFSFFTIYYLDLYYLHAPQFVGQDWLYAYAGAYKLVKSHYEEYPRIVFTDNLGQPYIFALFYLQMDPAKYQSENNFKANAVGDVGEVGTMDKFTFRPIFWPEDRKQAKTLFVGGEYDLPAQDLDPAEVVDYGVINNPDGKYGLRVVGTL